jgi:hypothetical protein
MFLNYPDNFTSPQIYQNSNYVFPHNEILSLKYNYLKSIFLSDQYIIPDYIKFYKNVEVKPIHDILKLNEYFSILGVGFMKLKGLDEKFDQLVADSLLWSANHTHSKYQNLINLYINENLNKYIYDINYITNIIQIMIINIVNHVIDYDEFPLWMNTEEFNKIINILTDIIKLTMIEIPVSETIYMVHIIPLIIELYQYIKNNVKIM